MKISIVKQLLFRLGFILLNGIIKVLNLILPSKKYDFKNTSHSRTTIYSIRRELEQITPSSYKHTPEGRHSETSDHTKTDYRVVTNSHNIFALPYQHAFIKKIIWDFKYYMKPYAVSICADMLYDELISNMSERINLTPFSRRSLVVYCPSSSFARGEKAFDHMKELLVEIEQFQNPTFPFFVGCIDAIVPQTSNLQLKAQHNSSRAERLSLTQLRFRFSQKFINFLHETSKGTDKYRGVMTDQELRSLDHAPPTKHIQHYIYCIDDVTTTGATFDAVVNLFKDVGSFKIQCIALSH
jgi:predicted amidophosphoribosyltransferase